MVHTNLRELFHAEPFTDGRELLYDSDGSGVYFIGRSGENLLMSNTPRVQVPMFRCAGGTDQVEAAVQDRFGALLGAFVYGMGEREEIPQVNEHKLVEHLAGRLKHGLHALVANEALAKHLEEGETLAAELASCINRGLASGTPAHEGPDPKPLLVYDAHNALPEGVVLGVSEREFLGIIMTDDRPRPEDKDIWPNAGLANGLAGQIIHVAMALRETGMAAVRVV